MTDMIDPLHYRGGRRFEPIEVIEDWALNYRLGNALKYISRNGRKPGEDPCEGLKKAMWYLQREIETLEAKNVPYALTYEDVLEDYAACAAEGKIYNREQSLDGQFDPYAEELEAGWDESAGPFEAYVPRPVAPSCEVDLSELHKDLDQFEDDEIIATFERRGLLFGVDRNGRSYTLGIYEGPTT
jgi:hypothetical protein